LAKAKTRIPENFVNVIPDRTELPIFIKADLALNTLLAPGSIANALENLQSSE
jgi:hypothetical protein